MILITGLDSIIESIYLREELTCSSKSSNIVVNPVSSYIVRKTIIINSINYPTNLIDELIGHNTIISRFDIGDDRVMIDPYELRMNERIIPLGKKVNFINEDMYDKVDHLYDREDGILYYPKPMKCMNYCVGSELTVLGYLAYQLGYPVKSATKFTNLDVIKLMNGLIV